MSREVSLYEPIGMDKEGNQIHLLDIVESEEPDVVEMMERTRQIEKLLGLVPKVLQGTGTVYCCTPVRIIWK